MITATIILLMTAGMSNACMDIISQKFDRSIFGLLKRWEHILNPNISWRNKYKRDSMTPRFFLSTTLLVGFTDLWHFAQLVQISALTVIIALQPDFVSICVPGLQPWQIIILNAIIYKSIYTGTFTGFYHIIFNLNTMKKLDLNYKLYKLTIHAFDTTSEFASRLLAGTYVVIILILSLLTHVIFEPTALWDDYNTWRPSYTVALVGVALWIAWFIWGASGGFKRMKKRYKTELLDEVTRKQ